MIDGPSPIVTISGKSSRASTIVITTPKTMPAHTVYAMIGRYRRTSHEMTHSRTPNMA